MGAIVGIVVGILGGALVTGVCMAAGHYLMRWVRRRTPLVSAQHHMHWKCIVN